MINSQDLRELMEELIEIQENIESKLEDFEEREDFHSGFQEGYA